MQRSSDNSGAGRRFENALGLQPVRSAGELIRIRLENQRHHQTLVAGGYRAGEPQFHLLHGNGLPRVLVSAESDAVRRIAHGEGNVHAVWRVWLKVRRWIMATATTDFAAEREAMVERQLRRRGISEPDILDAFRAVPREAFISDEYAHLAYGDHPLPIE